MFTKVRENTISVLDEKGLKLDDDDGKQELYFFSKKISFAVLSPPF